MLQVLLRTDPALQKQNKTPKTCFFKQVDWHDFFKSMKYEKKNLFFSHWQAYSHLPGIVEFSEIAPTKMGLKHYHCAYVIYL